MNNLKNKLEAYKGKWAKELPAVLWAYRTTPRKATGESPFSLVYGAEAVIPAEVGMPSLRTEIAWENEDSNSEQRRGDLDLIEERRDRALVRLACYQQAAARYYNKKVKHRHCHEGDLVLRKVFQNTKEWKAGKLGANWEGPYRVEQIIKPGVYRLEEMDGTGVPRSWNAHHLRRYYV